MTTDDTPLPALIPIQPVLTPARLVAGSRDAPLPFPLSAQGIQYSYLARNAIYWLARGWKLQDEEVLFPWFFNEAGLEALLAAGAKIRFYPVHKGMRVSVEDIASRITAHTRAIYLIHYSGFPGPVKEVAELCREREIKLIENCALAFLSTLDGKPLGTFGDAAIFCFHKPLPVPDGGALVVRDGLNGPVLPDRQPTLTLVARGVARHLITHFEMNGMTRSVRAARSIGNLGKAFAGSNAAPRAAIGKSQFDLNSANLGMSRLSQRLLRTFDYEAIRDRRRHNFLYLKQRLSGIVQPVFDELPEGVCPLNFPIYVQDRPRITDALVQKGIEAVPLWARSNPLLPEGTDPVLDELRRSILKLPCHQDLTEQHLDRIAACVESVVPEHALVPQ